MTTREKSSSPDATPQALIARIEQFMDWACLGVGMRCDDECQREIQALLREAVAALRAQQEPKWQDISTAPKDGREILCTWFHQFSDGRWHWANVMHVLSWFPDWYAEGQGAWVLDGDFNVHFEPDEVHETPPTAYGDPTHWMPLPSPPAASPVNKEP